ncbi:VIT1/CCC1 transporter family protein [Dermabacteraceae bacterium P9123]
MNDSPNASPATPTRAQISRWRGYLADEIAEASIYREFAARLSGEDQAILLAIADAESRHENHWRRLLGEHASPEPSVAGKLRRYRLLLRLFGPLFVLVLLQRAEDRSPYEADESATRQMAADEKIHGEVVRGLAAKGRSRLSGNFRAAVFGMNDGLVSNLSLVMGMAGTGVASGYLLASGLAGLLAGAFSMAAGEYVSVASQRELLEASATDPRASRAVDDLDLNENELTLVYRARGMSESEAQAKADLVMAGRAILHEDAVLAAQATEEVGSGATAALSSFLFFASGAFLPVAPFLFGMSGTAALVFALALVGGALMLTGAVVGLLSGAPPLARALRQLAIGMTAAGATYCLGLLFGTAIG